MTATPVRETEAALQLQSILSGEIPDAFKLRDEELPEKRITVLIRGLAPGLLLHNGQLADENNAHAQRVNGLVKKLKNSASEEVSRQLTEARMMGSLYISNNQPVLPEHMLSAALAKGASKVDLKKGKHWTSGIAVRGHAVIVHDGPGDIEELIRDERFQHRSNVKIGQATVTSVRPIFKQWAAYLHLSYETDLVDADTVLAIVGAAGRFVGIGDWRPGAPKPGKYGRFSAMGYTED